jgi:hypothetical protein
LDDHQVEEEECDDVAAMNVSYQHLQRKTENANMNEGHESMLQHIKERPLIKWILNINLVFLIVIEIVLFIIFSLPVKYTFWRE